MLCRDASNKKKPFKASPIPSLSMHSLELLVPPPKKFTERPKVIGDFFVSLSHPPMDKLDTHTYIHQDTLLHGKQTPTQKNSRGGGWGFWSEIIAHPLPAYENGRRTQKCGICKTYEHLYRLPSYNISPFGNLLGKFWS